VTGATSFIGGAFVSAAIARGWDVDAVTRPGSAKADRLKGLAGVSVLELCMGGYGKLGARLGRIDALLHCAWSGTRGKDRMDRELQRTNFELSVEAVRSALEGGCGKIMLAGSQAEYGPSKADRKVRESDECRPNTEYGVFKLKLYEKCLDLCGSFGAKLVEPRLFSVYGPGDWEGSMVSGTLSRMIRGLPCELTECSQLWDFLHIDDAAEGLALLAGPSVAAGIYNFGSGTSMPLRRYVEEMARITRTRSPLLYGAKPYPATGAVQTNPDISRLATLGWKPRVSFEAGVLSVLRALSL
jgi:nucleoside-diphosphate-sugar epimerase